MIDYRIYYLDAAGHITRAIVYNFDHDSEAVHFGQTLLYKVPRLEIWQHARLVKRLDGRHSRPHSPAGGEGGV